MFQTFGTNTFLVLLILMEIGIVIFSLLGHFNAGLYFVVVRIFFLVTAQCCKNPRSAAFYCVLAIMNGFYSFDPVGLFITGHGQVRTIQANIFCIIACSIAVFASYVGYHYKMALQHQGPEQQNAYNPAYLYNGNNTGYINPNDRNQGSVYPGNNNRFQAFNGQGYSLS